jgi:hypothetical protein
MKTLSYFLRVFGMLLLLMACTKTETLVIGDNTPPPDNTPKSFNREAYINRVYISLIGRKPSFTEKASAESILPLNAPTQTQLENFLETVFINPAFLSRTYDNARIDLLNNLDTAEITRIINTFDQIISSTTDPFVIDIANKEKARLEEMRLIPSDMSSGTLDRRGLHQRCINNWFYDQINMGTANFVISSFQNFLYRYPSESELSNGIAMVDGLSASLFLNAGNSKTNYMSIFFNSLNYAEGQVKDAYRRYVFREPTPNELSSHAVALHATWNYNSFIKQLLSSSEYAYQ